jgi:hypothetical protein
MTWATVNQRGSSTVGEVEVDDAVAHLIAESAVLLTVTTNVKRRHQQECSADLLGHIVVGYEIVRSVYDTSSAKPAYSSDKTREKNSELLDEKRRSIDEMEVLKACRGEIHAGVLKRVSDAARLGPLGRRLRSNMAEAAVLTAILTGMRIGLAEKELFGDKF